MATARLSVLDLAAGGDFDSLAQALMSLLLRHIANSSKNVSQTLKKYKVSNLRYLQLSVNTIARNFQKSELNSSPIKTGFQDFLKEISTNTPSTTLLVIKANCADGLAGF